MPKPYQKVIKGYRRVLAHGHPRANNTGHVYEHILIAELALGKFLPVKAVVHHHDESLTNNVNANLVICEDNGYHKLLHKRMRVLKAGGNPDSDKICFRCKHVLPQSSFYKTKITADGLQGQCSSCQNSNAIARRKELKGIRVEA